MIHETAHTRRMDIRLPDKEWAALDQAFEQSGGGGSYEQFFATLLLDGLALACRGGLAKRPPGIAGKGRER